MPDLESLLEIMSTGDFAEARSGFSGLLEKDPDEREFEAGLFTCAYWDNRSGFLSRTGEMEGNAIVQEWETFENTIEEKGYGGYRPVAAAMYVVLGKAADSFRKSFQNQGLAGAEFESLIELGRCLLRIEDYANAREILQFARKIKPASALALFLAGEGCLLDEDPLLYERGLGHFRDGFLIQPSQFPFDQVRSVLLKQVITALENKSGNDPEKILLWLPSEMMIHSMVPGMRRLNPDEINQLMQETERLENDLERDSQRYLEKIKGRLTFYYLVAIQAFEIHQNHSEYTNVFRSKLEQLSPEYYKKYRDIKKSG